MAKKSTETAPETAPAAPAREKRRLFSINGHAAAPTKGAPWKWDEDGYELRGLVKGPPKVVSVTFDGVPRPRCVLDIEVDGERRGVFLPESYAKQLRGKLKNGFEVEVRREDGMESKEVYYHVDIFG